MIFYFVRHGKAKGNEAKDPLTEEGIQQAKQLASFLNTKIVDQEIQLITSPFCRAYQTAEEIGRTLNLDIKKEVLLVERNLGDTSDLSDEERLRKIKEQFEHPEMSFPGGESNLDVTLRVKKFLDQPYLNNGSVKIIVSHRLTLSLLLQEFGHKSAYETFLTMTNPDVYYIKTMPDGSIQIEHIWGLQT
ncbi:histidine phosphatase family protein [Paenibacillus amylolyticus]|uniref:histidine phosphatase family protein n=1 Tax=Paenibacillus amylolyticus TaxID=1451 RepID=UPI003F81679E